MAKCLNTDCNNDVPQTPGKRSKLCCSDKCKTAFHRKGHIVTQSNDNVTECNRNSHIVTKQKGWTPTDTIDGAMAMWDEQASYIMGSKSFKTRQESDAEFTRLMAQDDRSRPNQRVSKPGDEDYDGICRQDADGMWYVPKGQAVGVER